jgi:hypothetical protein
MPRTGVLPALLLACLLPALAAAGSERTAKPNPGVALQVPHNDCYVYFVVRARPAMYFSAPLAVAASGRRDGALFPSRGAVQREYQRFLERLNARRRLSAARGGPAGVNSCDSRRSAERERQKTAREMRAAGWTVELLR